MDNSKPKKKWQSSRLKDKKKELGIEDKPPVEAPVVESEGFKPVKKAFPLLISVNVRTNC